MGEVLEIKRPNYFWVPVGAVLAPIIIWIFSEMHDDETMRAIMILIMVSIAGAIGGYIFALVTAPRRETPGRKIAFLLAGLLIFSLCVFLGYKFAKLGPF
ncbi:hypothetical protein BH23BAC2_BH23BAC2_06650 [soil metagenome]